MSYFLPSQKDKISTSFLQRRKDSVFLRFTAYYSPGRPVVSELASCVPILIGDTRSLCCFSLSAGVE